MPQPNSIFLYSSILIRTAQIGYAIEPEFELYAEGQLSLQHRIAIAMIGEASLWHACREEKIEKDWLNQEIAATSGNGGNRMEHIRNRL
jgi:hypothetical protein